MADALRGGQPLATRQSIAGVATKLMNLTKKDFIRVMNISYNDLSAINTRLYELLRGKTTYLADEDMFCSTTGMEDQCFCGEGEAMELWMLANIPENRLFEFEDVFLTMETEFEIFRRPTAATPSLVTYAIRRRLLDKLISMALLHMRATPTLWSKITEVIKIRTPRPKPPPANVGQGATPSKKRKFHSYAGSSLVVYTNGVKKPTKHIRFENLLDDATAQPVNGDLDHRNMSFDTLTTRLGDMDIDGTTGWLKYDTEDGNGEYQIDDTGAWQDALVLMKNSGEFSVVYMTGEAP